MRIALVVTPLALPDLRPAPGSLDGDVVRARLPLDDTGFRVVDLDAAVDLAEQIEERYDRGDLPREAAILFYASCRVILSEEGEIFLGLDPASPDTGDALADLALLFRERAAGPVAFVLECRHAPDPEDPFLSASVADAAKSAITAAGAGIELIVAAQPRAEGDTEDRPSPMTRALIEALDGEDAARGLALGDFFEAARESPQILGVVPCFARVRGRAPFAMVPPPAEPERERVTEPDGGAEPASDAEPEGDASIAEDHAAPSDDGAAALDPIAASSGDDAITDEMAPLAPAEVAEVLAARAPYRSEAASIPVEIEDAPPPPRAPYRSEVASIPIEIDDAESPAPADPPREVVIAAPKPADPPPKVVIAEPKPAEPPPKVVIAEPKPVEVAEPKPAEPQPKVVIAEPSAKPASVAPPAPSQPPPPPKAPATAGEHIAAGDALHAAGDHEGALSSYKRALALLAPSASQERASIYARQGKVKQAQDKRREAIAAFEKAIALAPATESAPVPEAHRTALEALVELNVAEGDWRAVGVAEERVLATLRDPADRFALLVRFGVRWQERAGDPDRARVALERARDLQPDDVAVLTRLALIYEQAKLVPDLLAARRRLAELTRDPRARAERYFELGQYCLFELRREELGLELLDKALVSDPTMLEPLAIVARVLADKQEWSELEQAYRRMLDRVDHMPAGPIRTQVTWELCRRLGFMFRDHLDDPTLALDAFEDAVHAKPEDLQTRLTAAEIARTLGKNDRAAVHLEAAAALDPTRVTTFHDLFESFQKLRRPDQAYQAACVTMFLRQADARERFIFEELKPHGVPKPTYALHDEAWDWLRPHDRDLRAEAVLAAVTPAAISARLAQLSADGRLPQLDPAGRQDPEKSTVSIVRSFTWASHFLAVPAPAVYLSDEPQLALASVIAEEPTVFAGQKVLRGRSLPELAFLVGRHLAYHVGGHRLLLYYPSIEELTACFLAAVRIVLPEVPAPGAMRAQVMDLERAIALRLQEADRVDLAAAVAAFEAAGSRAHLAEWVADVERCATRAGFLLAGDLEVAASVLRAEPRGVLDGEAKLADLVGFCVSDEHRALREAMGIAIEP